MLARATVALATLSYRTACAQYRDEQLFGTWHVPYEKGVTAHITFKPDHTFDFHYRKGHLIDRYLVLGTFVAIDCLPISQNCLGMTIRFGKCYC